MKFLKQLGLPGLAWLFLAQIAEGQPCVNGISTNPHNPINNQFVPMADAWFNLHPDDPAYEPHTDNPWLNQFSWYWPNSIKIYKHQVNWDHGWAENPPVANMVNPYDPGMPEGFEYLRPTGVATENLDYRWEDGWELLYMNLGYYPDLNHTNDPEPGSYYANQLPPDSSLHFDPRPSRAPYFIIYNRYRGLMRVVANVWYEAEATFNDIDVVLRFTDDSKDNNLTGLLRHASAYDKALSEPTGIWEIHAPRFHAPDLTQWLVADFQVGYDPCSCMSTGELAIDFNAFSTMDIEIIGRSISVDVPITELDYRSKDFLNLSAVNTDNYEPGTEIYQSMDALAESYRARQTKYLNDMNAYNQFAPFRMALEVAGLNAVGQYLASGITNITLTEDLYKWIKIPAYTAWQEDLLEGNPLPPATIEFPAQMSEVLDTTIVRAFSDKAKKEIGRVFGNLSAEIFKAAAPGKPKSPTVPVATIEESVYKGKIEVFAPLSSSPLILPGSLPQAWEPNTSLSPNRMPVYNEVLGKVALLNTPKPIANNDVSVDISSPDYWEITKEIQLRFDEELLFALNPALDFDLDQSATYAMLEIQIQEGNFYQTPNAVDTIYSVSNLMLTQSAIGQPPFDLEVLSTYSSSWFPMHELSNKVFSISESYRLLMNYYVVEPYFDPVLLSIKLKVMHDFQFDQIGTSGEKISTLDIFTYPVYLKDGVNHLQTDGPWSDGMPGYFDLYIPGLITLGDETITTTHPLVHHVDGDEIVINAQEVHITGPLQVEPGYTLIIQALEQIRQFPDAEFNPKIHMRIKNDFYDTPSFEYADSGTVSAFCNNSNAYQANLPTAALQERINQQLAEEAFEKDNAPTANSTSLTIFPNPAIAELTLRATGGDLGNITIYDTSGRPVMQANAGGGASEHRMDIGALAPGIYIVQAACGDEVHSEKLVVAR